jgi:hypothetical protein
MDIVQISNVFNALAQLHPDINFYHAGLAETINQSGIDNNFDPGNSTGKEYPLLIFPYDATRDLVNLTNQRQLARMEMTLLFYDTMFYDNDSKNDVRTEIEILRDLRAVGDGFLVAIRKANKVEIAGNVCNGLGIDGVTTITAIPFQHNDRVMCLRYDFTLTYFAECQPFDPDFALLVPPNAVPVPDYDLEDPSHA